VQYKPVLSSLPEGSMDYLLPTKTWSTCSYSALETILAFLNLCSNKPWLLWKVAGDHKWWWVQTHAHGHSYIDKCRNI